ncbi:hypothetical protein LP7551_03637 [Roseibium album]|nr:hypothetical protein LP7551_03637 [Roseibium album]
MHILTAKRIRYAESAIDNARFYVHDAKVKPTDRRLIHVNAVASH